ncbi:MAG: hypothetical protein EOO27_13045 [Comamonadaceae bacterium]|nr:MAG: hypothetical protein EOO27_13045 [Comamonadaceae bacterium]
MVPTLRELEQANELEDPRVQIAALRVVLTAPMARHSRPARARSQINGLIAVMERDRGAQPGTAGGRTASAGGDQHSQQVLLELERHLVIHAYSLVALHDLLGRTGPRSAGCQAPCETHQMKVALVLSLALMTCHAYAQKQVYKCETNGKIEYSHAPCIGAMPIDTTPTRGADKMSGKSRKSKELQMLEVREAIAEGTKPLHGMEKEQFLKRSDRMRLAPNARAECSRLDAVVLDLRDPADRASPDRQAAADLRLYQARKRYDDLNC